MDRQQRAAMEESLAKSHGNEFQAHVQQILRAIFINVWTSAIYQPDGGCDAYVPETRTVYQIYGPLRKASDAESSAKMGRDADTLRKHWLGQGFLIEHFIFLLNVPQASALLQRNAAGVLADAGIVGMAHGRDYLIALVTDRLSPLQVERSLGIPRSTSVEDRHRVLNFLELVERHCGPTVNLWANWGFLAAAFDAVAGGRIEQDLSREQHRVLSQDPDVLASQKKFLNAIRELMATVGTYRDIHTDGPIIERIAAQPFAYEVRARVQEFEDRIRPVKDQVREQYDFLHRYATFASA